MDKVKNIYRYLKALRSFLRMEFKKNTSLGFAQFLKNALGGFFSISQVIYDFNQNSKDQYLSDWDRLRKASRINSKEKIVFDNKLVFQTVFSQNSFVPKVLAIVRSKRIYRLKNGSLSEIDGIENLKAFVATYNNGLIAKPLTGGGGAGITKIHFRDGHLNFEGGSKSLDEFNIKVKSGREFLITEIIVQTGIIKEIYPSTLNTVRILTMYDPLSNKSFIASVVQRFGTINSKVVDNWTAGGISALIDKETGSIGLGTVYPKKGKLTWLKEHPDTGKKFYGEKVPNWNMITDYILKLADKYYFTPYLGWDVIPMSDGFLILEVNTNSDVNLLQVHGGLLKDEKVRSFYSYHKVI